MRFSFSSEQQLFADTTRELLTDHCPPSLVRAAWDGDTNRDLWNRLAEMGVVGLLAPEAAGGMGLDDLDLTLLLVETGRFAMVDPIVDTAAVAVPLLASAGFAGLDAIVNGERTVAVGFAADQVVRIDADALLLENDNEWHLVDTSDVAAVEQASVDGGRRLATIEWKPSADTLVTGDPGVSALARDRAIVGLSAQLVGLASHLLDATVEYVCQREQFGRPIGTQQSLKHKLADVRMHLEFARPVVTRAAHSLANDDPDASVHSAMAKVFAGDAATIAARHALQCHGAIAYTVEHDLHMWMKRVWALSAQWGDAATHRRRVAQHLGLR